MALLPSYRGHGVSLEEKKIVAHFFQDCETVKRAFFLKIACIERCQIPEK